MRKYYLFIIKNEYYKIYKKNPKILYRTMESLYLLKRSDIAYGVSLFNQICQPFSVRLLNNYIKDRYKYQQVSKKVIKIRALANQDFLQIGYATSIVFTNNKNPEIFQVFNIYNKKIFVCDFENREYTWLSQYFVKKGKKVT